MFKLLKNDETAVRIDETLKIHRIEILGIFSHSALSLCSFYVIGIFNLLFENISCHFFAISFYKTFQYDSTCWPNNFITNV